MAYQSTTTTRLVRNLPDIKNMLDHGPVEVTSHGRTEFVLVPKDIYDRYKTMAGTDADRLDAKLSLILDSITTMIFVTDRDLRVRRANRPLCNYLNFSPEEIVGKKLLEISESATFRFVAARAQHVLATGQDDSFELASSFREKRLISFKIRAWPNGVVIFADDATERAEAGERLLRSEAFDEALAAQNDTGVFAITPAGEIVFATRSLAQMVGVPQQNLAGGNFFAMLDPYNRSELTDFLRSHGGATKRMDARILLKGSDYLPVVMTVSPYPNMQGAYNFSVALRAKNAEQAMAFAASE